MENLPASSQYLEDHFEGMHIIWPNWWSEKRREGPSMTSWLLIFSTVKVGTNV